MDTSEMEAQIAEIVQADITARRRKAAAQTQFRHKNLITLAMAIALAAVTVGGAWFAYMEANAYVLVSRMGDDGETVQQTAALKVVKDYCQLSVPYVMKRALAIYTNKHASEMRMYEDQQRETIMGTPFSAGLTYLMCPVVQKMVNY